MSLFDYGRHESEGHGVDAVHQLEGGAALCTLCVLGTLGDPAVLAGRREYVARQFAELVSSPCGGRGQRLLHDVLARHAQPLVAHLLAALAVAGGGGGGGEGGVDASLADALLGVLVVVADGAPHFVPEMAADRCMHQGGPTHAL